MDYYDSPMYNMGYSQPRQNYQQPQQYSVPQAPVNNAPESGIKSGGFSFTVVEDGSTNNQLTVSAGNDLATDKPKRKRGRPRKTESTDIITPTDSSSPLEGDVVVPTMYTYQETTNMLRGTLAQIDEVAAQVKDQLDSVVASRTMKSKYSAMVGLSANLGDILSTKISAIKEINNAITKSNDMDYKRQKDRQAIESGQNDDKYLMDMYNAFIQNPNNNASTANVLGPSAIEATINAPIIGPTGSDQGYTAENSNYLNYVTNMTPEQRLMSMEDNPNVKLCVIYDAATGNKAFQWMDMSTGQAIPGLPQRDPMFLEDTTLNLKDKVARNINLNETYPLITINENVVNEY